MGRTAFRAKESLTVSLPLFHPSMVHFPIAFYFLELFLLILWHFKKDETYQRFALLIFRLAFAATVLAVISGLVDTGGLNGVLGKVKPHFKGAMVLLGVQFSRAIYWQWPCPKKKIGLIAGAVLGCLIMIWTAHEGGEIVYSE